VRRETGAAVPALIVAAAVCVLAVGAISVDLWRLLETRRQLTGHADAAATAAAAALDEVAYRRDPLAPLAIDEVAAVERACRVLAGAGLSGPCPGPEIAIEVEPQSVTVVVRRRVAALLVGRLVPGGADPRHEVRADARAVLVRGIPP
jgi:hypothetical protein